MIYYQIIIFSVFDSKYYLLGTGACRVAGEFFSRFIGKGQNIYMPNPTWGNHVAIMRDSGLTPQVHPLYQVMRMTHASNENVSLYTGKSSISSNENDPAK